MPRELVQRAAFAGTGIAARHGDDAVVNVEADVLVPAAVEALEQDPATHGGDLAGFPFARFFDVRYWQVLGVREEVERGEHGD